MIEMKVLMAQVLGKNDSVLAIGVDFFRAN
ncbi:hypothetical protein MNBD_ALPHA11-1701 [hydrothermal vent metagenome]|uniref:Uncharacterized protein n=1 Tax=hydrothermal vent metagenome TaxID=652676 RepID=A0A3B0TPM2_9ZZZZ